MGHHERPIAAPPSEIPEIEIAPIGRAVHISRVCAAGSRRFETHGDRAETRKKSSATQFSPVGIESFSFPTYITWKYGPGAAETPPTSKKLTARS